MTPFNVGDAVTIETADGMAPGGEIIDAKYVREVYISSPNCGDRHYTGWLYQLEDGWVLENAIYAGGVH